MHGTGTCTGPGILLIVPRTNANDEPSLSAGQLKRHYQLKQHKYQISTIIYSSPISYPHFVFLVISDSVPLHKLFMYQFNYSFLSY